MRIVGLLSMTALIMTGLPPSPGVSAAVLAAAQSREGRIARPPRQDDPDARCAPFLQGGTDYGSFSSGYGGRRGGTTVLTNGRRYTGSPPPIAYAPPSPPPPSRPAPEMRGSADSSVAVTGQRIPRSNQSAQMPVASIGPSQGYMSQPSYRPSPENRERYAGEAVAAVQSVGETPVSTFSVDVDTGSYSNVRRMLNAGEMPPQAAVRTEELLNYFRYDYPAPRDRSRPFSVQADMTTTPWNAETRLLRVGLRGYDLPRRERPAANLVFLVDVSGSMNSPDKLPLVQCSLALLADRLSPRDRVSIVVYAGAAGIVLEPTSSREAVVESLKDLQAGGSTAGGAGIQLAYDVARRNRIEGGINRVVLATDGDFNVGITNNETLVDMVEREREGGITLTTLGFGTGNYNEAMMEQIADHGNGNYAYIDSPREAQKVLDDELSSTLFTIAHDVKIQVEFNPAYVAEYRLIGYENRALREEDFDNDSVDAGDIGAGHQVTALYEVVPAGRRGWLPSRRYEANQRVASGGADNGELAFLRLRYKLPGQDQSRLIEEPVHAGLIGSARAPAGDVAFIAAVAAYGQLLRGDTNMGRFTFADARALAARNAGQNFWRREFVTLLDLAGRRQVAMGGPEE